MKRLGMIVFILALVLSFAMPASAIKLMPYSMPLQDIIRWDKSDEILKLSNNEGESLSVAWPSTVDFWNFDGTYWTWDLPDGLEFAFSKRVNIDIATTEGEGATVRGISITDTVGAALGIHEGIRSHVTSAYMTGSWTNAVVGVITYSATGSAGGGMAAPLMSEMNMQPAASSGGSYYNVHSYFNAPTSTVLIDSTSFNYAFELYELAGGAATQFDQFGLLWHIVGLTDATTKVLFDNTLKIQIDTTKWYIPLSSAEGSYTATTAIYINTTINTTVLPNNSDLGLSGYFQTDIEGTVTDANTYGFGAWVNIDAGATLNATAKYLAVQDNGIYDPGATVTNARIVFGLRSEAVMTNTDYEFLVPFSINSNKPITAVFAIDNIESIGFIEATSESASPVGYVPFFLPTGGSLRYIRVYDGTS